MIDKNPTPGVNHLTLFLFLLLLLSVYTFFPHMTLSPMTMLERGLARCRGTACGSETVHTQLAHMISVRPGAPGSPVLRAPGPLFSGGSLSQLLSLPAQVSSPAQKNAWSLPPPYHRSIYVSERKEVTGHVMGWLEAVFRLRVQTWLEAASPNRAELVMTQLSQQVPLWNTWRLPLGWFVSQHRMCPACYLQNTGGLLLDCSS